MTHLFRNIRLAVHVFLFCCSVIVLAIAANFASLFLPDYHESFIITALVVSSLSVLWLILLTYYSQPRTELFVLIFLAVAWTAIGAWASDIIGGVQCDAISSSQRMPAKNDGTTSARNYCNQMKVVEAFSWISMALFTIFTIILTALTTRAHALGRPFIWQEPISEVPWFGEYPGQEYDAEGRPVFSPRYYQPAMYHTGSMPGAGYPYPGMPMGMGGMPMTQQPLALPNGGGYVVQQQPGHSIVIQPNANGQPTVTQIPGIVQQA